MILLVLNLLQGRMQCFVAYLGEYLNSTRFFLPFWKYPFSIFFWTCSRWVLKDESEVGPAGSLGAFCPLHWNYCPLRWNFCPLWKNYRTLWWNHDAIPCINYRIQWISGMWKEVHCKVELDWTLLKVPVIMKNALDKNSLKLNFLKKKKNSGRISLPK